MDIVENIFNKYGLNSDEKHELLEIIYPIFMHPEFQKRLGKYFLHHSDITLGEHILEDAVVTYKLSKKYLKKHPEYRISLALKIAMFHDLYTNPWQNSDLKIKGFFNKHGFRHPIEAIINAINWFPELFIDDFESEIIIDGVLHHMYPLPVRVLNGKEYLANQDLFNCLDEKYKKMILESLKHHKIGIISFSRSKYIEGRIMSKADKKVAFKEIKNFSSAKALITGKNKSLKK